MPDRRSPEDPARRPLEQTRSRLAYVRALLAKAGALTPREWWLLGKLLGLLATLQVLERLLPLPRLVRFFDAPPDDAHAPPPARLKRLTTGLLRPIFGRDFCMKRSLLLFHFLRKGGHDTRLHFGVAKQDGQLKGHAWVDLNGHPFAEEHDPRDTYSVTYSYPSSAP